MTENEKARELIATSETTVKVDPQNGWYLKRFAALQFEGSVDNFGTNMPIHVLEQQLPKEDTMKLDDAVIEGQEIDYSRFYDEKGNVPIRFRERNRCVPWRQDFLEERGLTHSAQRTRSRRPKDGSQEPTQSRSETRCLTRITYPAVHP